MERVHADTELSAGLELAIATDEAIAAGWFGGACDGVRSRVGDVIVLAGDGVQLLYDYGHGTYTQSGSLSGLTSQEMVVPLIVVPGD